MAQINPDELYLKSRVDLLLYEDARFNGLLNATSNFYLVKNDQSLWGAFLRALAQELARLEFDYAYDLVNKQPQFLTPPDIDRRWSVPLSISSAYPSSTQTDLDYRNMLVALLAAYKEGATPKAIADVIFAYTGIQIVVQELYKQIGNGVFDQSDANAIRVSVNVGGDDPLLDIQTLNQLQLIVSSLSGAIDLAKPAHVGLEFTTVFGTDEDIDAFVTDIGILPGSPVVVTNPNGISDELTITLRLVEEEPFASPMLYQAPILDPQNPTTTLAPWGRQLTGPFATLSPTDWAGLPTLEFSILQSVSDGTNATFVYQFAGSPPPLQILHAGMEVTLVGLRTPLNITAQIHDVTATTFQIPSTAVLSAIMDSGIGVVTPTLKSAYTLVNGQYVVGMADWEPDTDFFQYQFILDSNGNTQMALNAGTSGFGSPNPVWSTTLNGITVDGNVAWRMIGVGQVYNPSYKWIALLSDQTVSFPQRQVTGEVGNWDISHPIGLLAPRLNQAWEISGGDSFQLFEMD